MGDNLVLYRRQRGSSVPDSWLNFKWTLSNCRVRTSSWGTMAAELSLSKLSFRLLRLGKETVEWQRLRTGSCERNAASLALDRFPNSSQRAVIWLSRRHNRFHIKIAHKQTEAPCLSGSWETMVISEMSPWWKPNRAHARVCVREGALTAVSRGSVSGWWWVAVPLCC